MTSRLFEAEKRLKMNRIKCTYFSKGIVQTKKCHVAISISCSYKITVIFGKGHQMRNQKPAYSGTLDDKQLPAANTKVAGLFTI